MIKQTITYEDYNGTKRTEDFHFNLTKAELLELEMGVNGGYTEMIKSIIKAQNTSELIKIFKELILKSYGEKSLDGRHFIKINDAGVPLSIAFSQTEAYSQLFMKLATDSDAAAAFVNGVVPKDVSASVDNNKIQEIRKELIPE